MHLIIVYLEFDFFGYITAEAAYGDMSECTTIINTVTDASYVCVMGIIQNERKFLIQSYTERFESKWHPTFLNLFLY